MKRQIILVFIAITLLTATIVPYVGAQETLEPLWMVVDGASDVAVSADGQYVVAAFDDEVRFYETAGDGTPLWTFRGVAVVMTDVAISADGNEVVVGYVDLTDGGGLFYLNDTTMLSGLVSDPTWDSTVGPLGRNTVDISDDGEYVVAVGTGPAVYYYEACTTKSGPTVFDWSTGTPTQYNECVDMTPDGRYVVTAGWRPSPASVDVYAFFFDMMTGNDPEMLWYIEGTNLPDMARFHDVAVSDDGYGVTASVTVGPSDAASMVIYCADATQLQGEVDQSTWMWMELGVASTSVAISSSGDEVVYGSAPILFTLCYWEGATTLMGYAHPPNWTMPLSVYDVAISADGEVVAAATWEPAASWHLRIYDRHGVELASDELLSPGYYLAMSRDGQIIAVAGDDEDSLYVYRFQRVVGGDVLPVSPLQALAPFLALVAIIASVVGIVYKKRRL